MRYNFVDLVYIIESAYFKFLEVDDFIKSFENLSEGEVKKLVGYIKYQRSIANYSYHGAIEVADKIIELYGDKDV